MKKFSRQIRTLLVGVVALYTLWIPSAYCAAQSGNVARTSKEKPGVQVLAVDFHGVLSRLSWTDLVCNLPCGIITSIYNSLNLVADHGLMRIQTIHLKEAFRGLNTQRPERDVFEQLKAAKEAGYKIVLFSNITPAEFTQHAQEYPELFANIFDLQIRTGPDKIAPDGRWLTKNDEAFYRHADNIIHKTFPRVKRITLLDDGRSNLERAKQYVGWEGIHITSTQTAAHVIKNLIITGKNP